MLNHKNNYCTGRDCRTCEVYESYGNCDVNNHNQVSLAFTIVPKNSITGPNRFEAPNQQSIKISMNQFQVELGYAFY